MDAPGFVHVFFITSRLNTPILYPFLPGMQYGSLLLYLVETTHYWFVPL